MNVAQAHLADDRVDSIGQSPHRRLPHRGRLPVAGEVDTDAASAVGQQLHAVAPEPAIGEHPMNEQCDRTFPHVGEADAAHSAAVGRELVGHELLLVCLWIDRSVGGGSTSGARTEGRHPLEHSVCEHDRSPALDVLTPGRARLGYFLRRSQ